MLADMLKPYRIKANNDVKIDGINSKGYRRSDFEQAWKSYLSESEATKATGATNLSNKNKKVAPVAPGEEYEDDFEPGAFEPDFDERRLQ